MANQSALQLQAAKKAKANADMHAAPHPSRYADALGSILESTAGVGPMNAHPRPIGMGSHMGGPGRVATY